MTIVVEKLDHRFNTFIPSLIEACLPSQGSIEVQHDEIGKEHAWHTHPSDETIVVLSGSLKFYWDGGERICKPGDVIQLPRMTRHGSIAVAPSRYIITFAKVDIGFKPKASP